MTAINSRRDSDEFAPATDLTHDLIICNQDRIVFHDHYDSPQQRLRMCVQLLTVSDIVAGTLDTPRVAEISQLHESMIDRWSSAPDQVINAIAKLCRRWGVQIYVSTTHKTPAKSQSLYSVITQYGPSQTIAEHFPSRAARRESLLQRAEQFFDSPEDIPEVVLADDQRLAALISALLMPAAVILTETTLDPDDGIYKPSGRPLPIR